MSGFSIGSIDNAFAGQMLTHLAQRIQDESENSGLGSFLCACF